MSAEPAERSRTAVITGGSSGIGQATALAFATQGWKLVLAARSEADLETVAAECRDAGAQVLVVPTDVGDAAAVQALARRAQAFGEDYEVRYWTGKFGVSREQLEQAVKPSATTQRQSRST